MPKYNGGSGFQTVFVISASGTANLTTGTGIAHFVMPFTFSLQTVKSVVSTAPTGQDLAVDLNAGGQTIVNGGFATAAGSFVSSNATLVSGGNGTTGGGGTAVDALTIPSGTAMTVEIVQVGSSAPGKQLKLYLYGNRLTND